MQLRPSPVSLRALELGIELHRPEKCRAPEFVEFIRSLKLDALIVAAYGQILPLRLLESAARGGINLHGSILPKYRGAAPIQRAILDGETETGITLMQMDKGMDSGDIIEIRTTPIGPDEVYTDLQDRLAEIAAEMIDDWALRIVADEYPRTPQDHGAMTLAPKIERDDTWIRFEETGAVGYRRFRAFATRPGSAVETIFGPMKVLDCRWNPTPIRAGMLEQHDKVWLLGFGADALELRTVQMPGKRAMSMADVANGLHLEKSQDVRPRIVENS